MKRRKKTSRRVRTSRPRRRVVRHSRARAPVISRRDRRGRPRRRVISRPRRAAGSTIRAMRLGRAVRLIYVDVAGKRRYHDFPRGTVLAYTHDKTHLVIPARIQEFIT